MGNCGDSKQIRVQNETIELMRKDLETTKEMLQCLMTNSPDKAEEVELLRIKALSVREHKELSDLILLQREVDKLKTNLKMDPNLVLTDIENEIRNLQHQITALKAVQSLTNEFSALTTPPFATFVSIPHNNIAPKKKSTADSVDGNEVWQVRSWKDNSFRIEIDGIVVLTSGLYEIFSATQTNGSYYSGSRCILRINNEDFVNVPQAESGATYLHGLFLIETGSVISMYFLDASKKFKLSRYLPPTVLDIVLMKA